jgi:hypothetical protein
MVLDELAEIVTKYRNSLDILIGGDVNASIHRSKLNSRDNDFQKFLMAVETSVSQIEPTNELTLLTVSASTCFNFNFISISTNFSRLFCRNCGNGGKIHNISEGVFKHVKS